MKGVRKLAALCALSLVSGVTQSQSTVSNLQQAVNRAVTENPEVNAAYYEFEAASQAKRAARGGYYPDVDVVGSIGRETSETPLRAQNSYTESDIGIAITQMLFDGFETRSEVDRLGHEQLAAYFDLKSATERTIYETALAYLDVARFQELVRLAEENYLEHKDLFDDIQSRVDAGVSRRVDIEQATARFALAESNLLTETSNLYDVTLRFQRIVGALPADELASVQMNAAALPGSRQAALNEAHQGNPALSSRLQDVKAAEAFEDQSKAPNYPHLDLRLRQSTSDDTDGILGNQNERAVELVLTYNLYNGGTDVANQRRALFLTNAAEYRLEQECRNTNQALLIAYNDIRALERQVVVYEQNLESIVRARAAYRDQFDINERTLLDLLDTENEYFEVSRELVNARHDLESAKAEVMAILGRLTGNQMVDGAYVEAMNSVDLSEHSTDELAPYCVFNLPAEMDVDGFELYAQELEETGRAIVYGINFAFDSADIEPSSESVLLDVLAVLNNDSGLALTIEGHTDSTGDNDYNLDLSQRRAQSVVDWLIANGVAVGRLNALGYGEERPVADNATAEGRAANRRVELKK